MSRHCLVVFSNPVEGREDEYNDWYTNTHLRDVLKIPGFIGAQRFARSKEQLGSEPLPYRYMAIYDIETDDIKATMEALGKAAAAGEMMISRAMDMEHIANWIFTPMSKKMVSGAS